MRNNTSKQTAASRRNGSKSKGPKTPEGKSKVAQNAIGDGLFSRQVVVPSLDEKPEDFEAIKRRVCEALHPTNTVEEMLAVDFVENWWRRERIRKAEVVELEIREKVLYLRKEFKEQRRFELLRTQFALLYSQYILASRSPTTIDVSETTTKLEHVRQELLNYVRGVDFLVMNLRSISDAIAKSGKLSLGESLSDMGIFRQRAEVAIS